MNKNPVQGRFVELDHTADSAIRVTAPDLPSLFRYSADGMYHQMGVVIDENSNEICKELKFDEDDFETLLISFLNELLFYSQKKVCFKKILLRIDSLRLFCSLSGYEIKSVEREIKAATFHNLEIENQNGGYSVSIVFDI